MNRLEGILLGTQKGLKSLIEDTEAAIGEAADQGYKKLKKIPAAEHHPLDVPNYGIYGDRRFFQARRLVRATEMPTEPVVLGRDKLTITEIATEDHRRRHYFPNTGIALPLPSQQKLVTVKFRRPSDTYVVAPNVAISTRGYASMNTHTTETYPRASGSSLTDKYSDVPTLQSDYARSFTGGLVEFVAESLHRVHGLGIDTRDLRELRKAWQLVAPVEVYSNVAKFLPKKARKKA